VLGIVVFVRAILTVIRMFVSVVTAVAGMVVVVPYAMVVVAEITVSREPRFRSWSLSRLEFALHVW
jgi:type IV secretory pathway VirB3-like protein